MIPSTRPASSSFATKSDLRKPLLEKQINVSQPHPHLEKAPTAPASQKAESWCLPRRKSRSAFDFCDAGGTDASSDARHCDKGGRETVQDLSSLREHSVLLSSPSANRRLNAAASVAAEDESPGVGENSPHSASSVSECPESDEDDFPTGLDGLRKSTATAVLDHDPTPTDSYVWAFGSRSSAAGRVRHNSSVVVPLGYTSSEVEVDHGPADVGSASSSSPSLGEKLLKRSGPLNSVFGLLSGSASLRRARSLACSPLSGSSDSFSWPSSSYIVASPEETTKIHRSFDPVDQYFSSTGSLSSASPSAASSWVWSFLERTATGKLTEGSALSFVLLRVVGGPWGAEPLMTSLEETTGPLPGPAVGMAKNIPVGIPLLFLVALFIATPQIQMTAELCAAFPLASNGSVWVVEGFGGFWGCTAWFWSWISGAAENAACVVLCYNTIRIMASHGAIGASASPIIDALSPGVAKLSLVLLFSLPNLLSTAFAGRALRVCGFLQFVPLLVLLLAVVGIAAWSGDKDKQAIFPVPHVGGEGSQKNSPAEPQGASHFQLPQLIVLSFFVLSGFDCVGTIAASVTRAQEVLPRTLLTSLLLTLLGYVLVGYGAWIVAHDLGERGRVDGDEQRYAGREHTAVHLSCCSRYQTADGLSLTDEQN